jgi:hypothetical protein
MLRSASDVFSFGAMAISSNESDDITWPSGNDYRLSFDAAHWASEASHGLVGPEMPPRWKSLGL